MTHNKATVKTIIRSHHDFATSLSRGEYRGKVNLAQNALADLRIFGLAVCFLIFPDDVLDESSGALFFGSLDECRSHFSYQKRVFAVALKISTAERITRIARARSKKKIPQM